MDQGQCSATVPGAAPGGRAGRRGYCNLISGNFVGDCTAHITDLLEIHPELVNIKLGIGPYTEVS